MCNSQLYSMWQLHIPDHSHWQVLDRSVTSLEEGLCDDHSYIRILYDPDLPGNSWFKVTCQRQDHSTLFSITEHYSILNTANPFWSEVIWSGMTKDQLWHRLASAPEPHSASMEQLCPHWAESERVINELAASMREAGIDCTTPLPRVSAVDLLTQVSLHL